LDFRPRRFLESGHVQTIYNVLFPPDNTLQGYSEDILLPTSDDSGDHLYLRHSPKEFGSPYLILLHGMEGSSESHYMVSVAKEALLRSYGVVRVNLRNCGKGFGLATRPYNAGQTEDLHSILEYVSKNYTQEIYVSGFSLSANLVLKYFGEREVTLAKAFSATSPPMDLKRTCDFIDSRAGTFYRNHFLQTLREKVASGLYSISEEMTQKVMKAKTFFDFDDFFTAPLSGYLNALNYYSSSSSFKTIQNIKLPGLVVHAKDDPVVPSDFWEEIPWKSLPHIKTILTDHGGHVGFVSDPTSELPDGRWLPKLILDYFDEQRKTT